MLGHMVTYADGGAVCRLPTVSGAVAEHLVTASLSDPLRLSHDTKKMSQRFDESGIEYECVRNARSLPSTCFALGRGLR
jgi:hypothetical protein